jgi:hypothetical protein
MFCPALIFAPERARESIMATQHFGVNMRKRLTSEIRSQHPFLVVYGENCWTFRVIKRLSYLRKRLRNDPWRNSQI